MKVIPVQLQHIEYVVEIFCSAFQDSIEFFTPMNDKIKNAIYDLFKLLLITFGNGFMVAVYDEQVCGYIVMVDNIKKLWLKAFTSGYLFKMALKALLGKYGLNFQTLFQSIKNKLFYMKFEVSTQDSAQVLSIAVDSKYRGKGVGGQLLQAGLKYVSALGAKTVKLEARPDNVPAVKLYKKFGFKTIGKTQDLQGEWLIMVKNLANRGENQGDG